MSKITVATMLYMLGMIALSACAPNASEPKPAASGGSGGMDAIAMSGSGGVTSGASGGSASIASGGAGGAIGGAGGSGGATVTDPGMPTFTRVWREVLVKKSCNSGFCHGMAAAGLSMRNEADAYMNIVGVSAAGPKCGTSGMLRVKAGDPTQSLLLDKISNATPACGDPMPIGTTFEPNCVANTPEVCNTRVEVTLVRDWISAGALHN